MRRARLLYFAVEGGLTVRVKVPNTRMPPPTRRGFRREILLAIGAAVFLALSSCATVPHLSVPTGTALTSLLPSDAFAYASIKVSANNRLVGDIVGKSELKHSIPTSVLDKTSRLYASAQLGAGGKPGFSLIGVGSYPVGLIGWRLDWSRDWKRSSTPLPWWQERTGRAQIAVPTKNLVMVSTESLPVMLEKLTKGASETLPPTIMHTFEASDLAIYFPRVGDTPLFGKEVARFPIKSFYFSINADGAKSGGGPSDSGKQSGSTASASAPSGYHGFAVFQMNSARDARLFSVVFRLLIASSESGAAIRGFPIPLAGSRLTIDGDVIRLQGIAVTESELADLISKVIGGRGVGL